jgi:phosphoserine phosphatase
MPALTTAAMIALGAGVARGIGAAGQQYFQGQAMMGEDQKKRLDELKRKEEMNALGLTDNEQSELNQIFLDPMQAVARESMQRQQALIGPEGGASSGVRAMMKMEEDQQRQAALAANKVAEAQQLERRREEDELRALQDREAASKATKQGAALALLTGTVSSAGEAYLQQQAFQDMVQMRSMQPQGQTGGIYLSPSDLKLLEEF